MEADLERLGPVQLHHAEALDGEHTGTALTEQAACAGRWPGKWGQVAAAAAGAG